MSLRDKDDAGRGKVDFEADPRRGCQGGRGYELGTVDRLKRSDERVGRAALDEDPERETARTSERNEERHFGRPKTDNSTDDDTWTSFIDFRRQQGATDM